MIVYLIHFSLQEIFFSTAVLEFANINIIFSKGLLRSNTMKNLYIFFCSLAMIITVFSPANAQRKNTTKHDISPSSIMEKFQKNDELDCHKIKEQYKQCKHMKKEHKKHKKHKKHDY